MKVHQESKKGKDSEGKNLSRLGELYSLYRPALYHYALRICANKEEAEDLVEETFWHIIPHEEDLRMEEGKQIFSYLRTTLRNIFIDKLSSLKDRTCLLLGERNPEVNINSPQDLGSEEICERLILDEALERLGESFKELPQFAQTVLYLRFTCQFSASKIASILGCSRRKVRETTINSLKYLKEKLKEYGLMEEENGP